MNLCPGRLSDSKKCLPAQYTSIRQGSNRKVQLGAEMYTHKRTCTTACPCKEMLRAYKHSRARSTHITGMHERTCETASPCKHLQHAPMHSQARHARRWHADWPSWTPACRSEDHSQGEHKPRWPSATDLQHVGRRNLCSNR